MNQVRALLIIVLASAVNLATGRPIGNVDPVGSESFASTPFEGAIHESSVVEALRP